MSLHEGDCLEVLATLDEASVDAVVTDPPYGIAFMGSQWDDLGNARAFQAWTERWATLALRALKPGGALLAMGATRLYHRTACGIQDAGFEMRDSLAWLYGSGFPKSSNYPPSWPRYKHPAWYREHMGLPDAPCTDGHPSGPLGTAFKPSWEPVVVARKPLDGSHEANYERHGAGFMDIDAMRVPLNGDTVPEFVQNGASIVPGRSAEIVAESGWRARRTGGTRGVPPARKVPVGKVEGDKKERNLEYRKRECEYEPDSIGRWPANVAHDGSEAVMGEFPHTVSGYLMPYHSQNRHAGSVFPLGPTTALPRHLDDLEGSAARFFYTAKPSRTEKEAGLGALDGKDGPELTNRKPGSAGLNGGGQPGRTAVDRKNIHPTCKPIELFRWLVRGFVPRGGLVLDPFAGSGTTAIAAVLEGRRWIAVEREREYAEIARARIEWWAREAARKPGRSVAEILGEVALPKHQAKDGPVQGALL